MGSAHSQPVEILDRIFSFIEKPSDLLHIGLTAKQYRDVVIPHHIEYRIIRSDCRRVELWEQLAKYPGIASKFVTLEIIEEREGHRSIDGPVIFPRSLLAGVSVREVEDWDFEGQEDGLRLLAGAVKHMSQLVRFFFSDARLASNEVFAAVKDSCKHLTDAEVLAFHDCPDDGAIDPVYFDFVKSPVSSFSSVISSY